MDHHLISHKQEESKGCRDNNPFLCKTIPVPFHFVIRMPESKGCQDILFQCHTIRMDLHFVNRMQETKDCPDILVLCHVI